MKTKVTSLLVVLIAITTSCMAQRTFTVEAQNNDISNNLDLQAVASTFGESKDLEDFERRLNDYDSQISNLDLNNDGEVDYLRVIENMENNVHVVVIQAVLGRDIYQDVATVVVERRDDNRRTMVQIIGDPYLYGSNYVIEPVYVYTPSIFSFFWGYNYRSWYSPYYYGYYPRYYHSRRPFEVGIYLSNIGLHINYHHRYYYTDHRRNDYYERLHHSMSRNDYGTRYPDRNFSRRNVSIANKRAFDNARANNTVYDRRESRHADYDNTRNYNGGNASRNSNYNSGNYQQNSNRGSNNSRSQNDDYQRTTRNDNQNRPNTGRWQSNNNGGNNNNTSRSTQTYAPQTNTAPSTPQTGRNAEMSRSNTYQQPPVRIENRQPAVTRESSTPRQAPVVISQPSQSSRSVETKPVERRQADTQTSSERSSGGRR